MITLALVVLLVAGMLGLIIIGRIDTVAVWARCLCLLGAVGALMLFVAWLPTLAIDLGRNW